MSLKWFVIPGLTKLAPYSIRGNPVLKILVPCFRRDDVWIPAFAGMTPFIVIRVTILKLRTPNSRTERFQTVPYRRFCFLPFARTAQAKEAAPLAWATVSGMSLGP